MHRAIDNLELRPEYIIVDGNRFRKYGEIPHHTIVKGDSRYLSIAAASVLAKTYRDEIMCKLHEEFAGYGWKKQVGYPTVAHRKAITKYLVQALFTGCRSDCLKSRNCRWIFREIGMKNLYSSILSLN